jgi:hypothetical protein
MNNINTTDKMQQLIEIEARISDLRSEMLKRSCHMLFLSLTGETLAFAALFINNFNNLDLNIHNTTHYIFVALTLFFAVFSLRACYWVFSTLLNSYTSESKIHLFQILIDEEGLGYLDDLRSGWERSGFTNNQIKKRELMFAIDYYWGMFISWLRLPRILSSTKTR